MSVYHHIRQLVVQDFFQQGLIFLENHKNWFSFVFTMLPKHIKIKSPLKYKSVCVAERLSLQVSALLYHHMTAPLEVRISAMLDSPLIYFFNFELVHCLPSFHC